MKNETSAGIVVFFNDDNENLFLLLQYNKKGESYWGLPKGHVENNEDLIDTAIRETKEETGLDIKPMNGFMTTTNYKFRENEEIINKTAYFFLGESYTKNVNLSNEHVDFIWLNYDDAVNKLTYDNDKKVFVKVKKFLK
jgi:bis(5'-nucleosidyl)-tetraphosphatase